MAYIAANGGTLTHEEDKSSPGYTKEGDEIGRRAVLTPLDDAFNAQGNAFEFAPLHLMQVLSPMLSRMGVWGGCATTNAGYDRKADRRRSTRTPATARRASTSPSARTRCRSSPATSSASRRARPPARTSTSCRTERARAGSRALRSTGRRAGRDPHRRQRRRGTRGLHAPGGIIIPVAPLARGDLHASRRRSSRKGGAALAHVGLLDDAPPPAAAPAAAGRRSARRRPPARRRRIRASDSLRLRSPRRRGRKVRSGCSPARRSSAGAPRSRWSASCAGAARAGACTRTPAGPPAALGHRPAGRAPDGDRAAARQGADDQGVVQDQAVPARRRRRTPRASRAGPGAEPVARCRARSAGLNSYALARG